MPQTNFSFNGEQYLVTNDTNPPSVWRMSAQGPVLMSTSNPGWGGPELRQKVNQALQNIGSQPRPAPTTPSSAQGGQGAPSAAATPTLPQAPTDYQAPGVMPGGAAAGAPSVNAYGTVGEPSANLPPGSYSSAPATPNGPSAANQSDVEQRILNQYGRKGWTVTGRTDEMVNQTVTDKSGLTSTQRAPSGNQVWAIAGPDGKGSTITVHPSATTPGDFDVVKPPENADIKPQLTPKDAQYVKGYGYYLPIDPDPAKLSDPNNWQKILPDGVPNADEEMKKALDRIDRQQEMTEKQNNFAAGRGYQSDADYQKMALDAQKQGLDENKFKQSIAEFNANFGESKRQFDIKQADTDKKTQDSLLTGTANRALTGAQTAGQEATTKATISATGINEAKLPGELAQQGATLAKTQEDIQTAQQARQIAGAPQLNQNSLTQSLLTQTNPLTGAVSQDQINKAYVPKTQAEIAARVGQLNDLMARKSAEVQGKVNPEGGYTHDNALNDFNQWYAQNIQPQLGALQAAQEDAAFTRGKEQAAMRTSAYTAANAAGTQNINAFNAMAGANPVGPNFEAANAAASKGDFGALSNVQGATTWQGPNPMDTSQAATMNALKYIDPTAAAATGTPPPNYQQMDVGAMLRNPYAAPGMPAPQGGPAQAAAAPAPAQGGAALAASQAAPAQQPTPGGMPQPFWDNLFGRIRSDQADQGIQAAAMPNPTPPGMYNPQFQAMNPSAVGQPATGPIVGGIQMPDWLRNGTPPDQPPNAGFGTPNLTEDGTPTGRPIIGEAPPWWRQMMSSYTGM